MDITTHCPLASALAERVREQRLALSERWLERIAARVALDPNRVFPTDELLDHVPILIDGVADYIDDPTRVIGADVALVAKAMELGALRYDQGFDEYEILKEFEMFGGIIHTFLAETADSLDGDCTRGELIVCAHRLFRAIALIQQATVTHYLRLMKEQLHEREERLRAFNRALQHEMRNQIGAAQGAAELLGMSGFTEERRVALAGVVRRNVSAMAGVLENLVELSTVDSDARRHRHIFLSRAVAEVARELRDRARAAGVEIRVGESLPHVEVPAAAVELVLTNYITNAIKYADPSESVRWVSIDAECSRELAQTGCDLIVHVRDNGLGVSESNRSRLFEAGFRARDIAAADIEGTGMGLSIVRDTVEALHGRAWATFPHKGSIFAFSIPCRRADDFAGGAGLR